MDPARVLPGELFLRVLEIVGFSEVEPQRASTLYDYGYQHVREHVKLQSKEEKEPGIARAAEDLAVGTIGNQSSPSRALAVPRNREPYAYEPWNPPPIPERTLDAVSLIRASWVCRSWRTLATSGAIWNKMCERLWEGKVHVPEKFKELRAGGKSRLAYIESLIDSRRFLITEEELLMFEWHSRMKADSGEHWTDEDPWWQGKPARSRRFLPDGTMQEWRWSTEIRKWRFVASSGGRVAPRGAFIRSGRGPAGVVSRHSNWGWTLQSCWAVSCSFPLPPRNVPGEETTEDPELTDEYLKVTVEEQSYEARCFNNGIDYPDNAILDAAGYRELLASRTAGSVANEDDGTSVAVSVQDLIDFLRRHGGGTSTGGADTTGDGNGEGSSLGASALRDLDYDELLRLIVESGAGRLVTEDEQDDDDEEEEEEDEEDGREAEEMELGDAIGRPPNHDDKSDGEK